MRKITISIFFIVVQVCFSLVFAKDNDVLSASQELEKLKQEKHALESDSKKREAACYKKFEVNNCLQEIKKTTQISLNAIKRRELEIKDVQRNEKIQANDKKRIDKENSVAPNDRKTTNTESENKTGPIRSIKTDDEIAVDKVATDKLRAEEAKRRLDDTNRKLVQSQRKNQSRENKNKQAADNIAKYNQKLALAAAKEAALKKENSERKKPKSASLPIPTALSDVPPPDR
jgi:colicin import membrane protein